MAFRVGWLHRPTRVLWVNECIDCCSLSFANLADIYGQLLVLLTPRASIHLWPDKALHADTARCTKPPNTPTSRGLGFRAADPYLRPTQCRDSHSHRGLPGRPGVSKRILLATTTMFRPCWTPARPATAAATAPFRPPIPPSFPLIPLKTLWRGSSAPPPPCPPTLQSRIAARLQHHRHPHHSSTRRPRRPRCPPGSRGRRCRITYHGSLEPPPEPDRIRLAVRTPRECRGPPGPRHPLRPRRVLPPRRQSPRGLFGGGACRRAWPPEVLQVLGDLQFVQAP